MSNHALSWAWKQTVSDPTSKLILIKLADQANDDGECWPSQRTLAAECGVSVPTVKRRVALLEEQGLLTRNQRRASGFHQSNLYLLAMDGGSDVIPGVDVDGGSAVIPDGGSDVIPKEPKQELSIAGSVANAPEPAAQAVPKAVRIDGRDLPFDALRRETGILDHDQRGAREVATALNGNPRASNQILREGIRALAWREVVDGAFVGDEQYAREAVAAVPESFEKTLAEMIERRARQYRERMPGAMLTPTALWKWWLRLEGLTDERRGSDLTADEMVRFPDA